MSEQAVTVVLLTAPLLIGALIAAFNAAVINDATERAESVIRAWQRRASGSPTWLSRFLINPILWCIVKFCDWTDRFTHVGLKNGTRVATTLYLIGLWLLVLYVAAMIAIAIVASVAILYVLFKVLAGTSGSKSDSTETELERRPSMSFFATECRSCGSKNHATNDCPHGVFSSKCNSCGSVEHATGDCPHGIFSSKCNSCGSKDHATGDCPHGIFSSKCGSCGSLEHATGDCPHGIFSSKCANCESREHATGDCPH